MRATPVQMRKALEAVNLLKKAGILFVPMPTLDEADHEIKVIEMMRRLEELEARSLPLV